MSKKNILLLLLVGSISVFTLTGCGDEFDYTPNDVANSADEADYNPAYEGYIPDIMMQEPEDLYHIVLAGETVISIAEIYGLDAGFLLEFNGLASEMDVVPGLLLLLPPGTELITLEDELVPDHGDLGITLTELPADLAFTDNYINWNYAAARQIEISGVQLMIESPLLLRSFAFIDVEPIHDEVENIFVSTATDVLFYVGDLEPNVRFIIGDFFTHGTLARSGFTFIDETGTRRYFDVHQSMMSGEFFFTEFYQDDFTFWDNNHQ